MDVTNIVHGTPEGRAWLDAHDQYLKAVDAYGHDSQQASDARLMAECERQRYLEVEEKILDEDLSKMVPDGLNLTTSHTGPTDESCKDCTYHLYGYCPCIPARPPWK